MFHRHKWSKYKTVTVQCYLKQNRSDLMHTFYKDMQQRECNKCGKKELIDIRKVL